MVSPKEMDRYQWAGRNTLLLYQFRWLPFESASALKGWYCCGGEFSPREIFQVEKDFRGSIDAQICLQRVLLSLSKWRCTFLCAERAVFRTADDLAFLAFLLSPLQGEWKNFNSVTTVEHQAGMFNVLVPVAYTAMTASWNAARLSLKPRLHVVWRTSRKTRQLV